MKIGVGGVECATTFLIRSANLSGTTHICLPRWAPRTCTFRAERKITARPRIGRWARRILT